MPEGYTVRRVRISDADRVRSIRIESLGDPAADIAFLGSRERALAQPTEFWQERTAAVALSGSAAQFVAESGREWFGTVTVLIAEPTGSDSTAASRPSLVAVYVRPSQRGRGILEAMVDAAAAWVGDAGGTELALEVHEDNVRARRAYERLGFVPTGRSSEGPNGTEHEMVRRL